MATYIARSDTTSEPIGPEHPRRLIRDARKLDVRSTLLVTGREVDVRVWDPIRKPEIPWARRAICYLL
jgi:hypothetical protein